MLSSISDIFLKLQCVSLSHQRADSMQPLLSENSNNRFSGPVEYKSSAMSTDPVRIPEPRYCDPPGLMFPKDGRMVLVLPAWLGFHQRAGKHRAQRPTLTLEVKVNKHQVELAKLSPLSRRMHPRMRLILIQVREACETHSAGECIFEWVWIPFMDMLSGVIEDIHWPSLKVHLGIG